MTFRRRIEALVDRIDMPEDLTLAFGGSDTAPWLQVKTWSDDTYGKGGRIPLVVNVEGLHPNLTDEEIFSLVLVEIVTLRDHETRETFKVDGKPFREPHNGRHEDRYDQRRIILRNVEDVTIHG